MLDVYLSEQYSAHWPEIVKLAQSDDEKSKSKLRGYALEGYRLSTKGFGFVRCGVAQDITVQDGVTTWNIASGDETFVDLVVPHNSVTDLDRCKSGSRCLPRARSTESQPRLGQGTSVWVGPPLHRHGNQHHRKYSNPSVSRSVTQSTPRAWGSGAYEVSCSK